MHAVLLFSATVHLAVLGLLAAAALRSWAEARRPREMGLVDNVTAAGALGVCTALAVALLMWLARPFSVALATGLAAGVVVAVAFLLALGAWPTPAPSHGGPRSPNARRVAGVGIGLCVLTELVAFCFLAGAAGA